ncbi:MAG: hypothetical protein CSB33_02065 [Desulfobacterales bacterium]|nr:MAG: hypothetical protein CSB33_02065 [Desulfobacterales bacterium]
MPSRAYGHMRLESGPVSGYYDFSPAAYRAIMAARCHDKSRLPLIWVKFTDPGHCFLFLGCGFSMPLDAGNTRNIPLSGKKKRRIPRSDSQERFP